MNRDARNSKVFARRTFVIGALQASVLAVLGCRLAWLQIVEGRRYKMLSDKNRINVKMVPPSRGQIVDRFGVPLAVNNQNFRVLLIPERTDNIENVLRRLQKLIPLNEKNIQDVLARAKEAPKFLPIEVKNDLTWEEVTKIEVNLPDLSGLFTETGEIRSYPFGESTAHIIGYVGLASKNEVKDDPVLSMPGFRIGKTGVEKQFDKVLRGRAGATQVEVNVVGREVRELSRRESIEGSRVSLTIDGELQRFVQQRLSQERSACAVIIDADTGAVYALASHPSFDPNVFVKGLSASEWEELLANDAHPLTNKVVAGQYPPASTFKMVSALAGLRSGKTSASHTVFCPGFYEYGGDRFHCWKHSGHGTVNMTGALSMSCDTYFYEMATDIGIDNLAKTARIMGLGQKLDFDLPEEHTGLIPDRDWKMGYFGESWKPGETIIAAIGQGYIQATPLQLAVMTARLVNGGYAVKPWLSAYIDDRSLAREVWPKLDLDPVHLKLIKRGMDSVVNDNKGTAYGSRIQEPSMAMGGKTGTAQVAKITQRQRAEGIQNEDLPWKQRHHGLFVGYAPLKKPKYVTAVVVEHGVGGSASAAPIAKDILLETQKRDPGRSSFYLE